MRLIYCIKKGEFHLGMMSGRGKYIWSNGIIYEGEFLNNEISGSGVYTWCNLKYSEIPLKMFNAPLNLKLNSLLSNDPNKWSTYEGDVFKGKRHGIGTFKSGNCPVVYIGEWNTGKRYGKVDFNNL